MSYVYFGGFVSDKMCIPSNNDPEPQDFYDAILQ